MNDADALLNLRQKIRDMTLAPEEVRVKALIEEGAHDPALRATAQKKAALFVRSARAGAARSTLVDRFLQEYGLSSAEGVTLMRLAEALLRTPDATTADALIKDKVESGDWAAHKGKSPFPLVNFSTRGLMLTAAWLDDIEGKGPARNFVRATKDILDRVGEPVIRGAVAQAMRIMGEHFVLGETIGEAQKRARDYAKNGYSFSFDMLGEAAHTAEDAEKYFNDYRNAIAEIARTASARRPVDNPGISVKLSALHPRYEYGKRERVLSELGAKLNTLAAQARDANIGFNIDAEEAARLDLSLDLIEALMRDPGFSSWEGFGIVVQAYQRRAPFVIDWLAMLARQTKRRITVRLVKGAYWDAEVKRAQMMGLESYPVFTRKILTDISFETCAKKLFANADVIYPQFATHNALTAALVREMAGEVTDYELQRLHGMGEALHDSLLEDGARSRIYAPVGSHKELLPYLVRRLLENGANSSFVNQLFDPDLSVDDIVADPVEDAKKLDVISNPSIPAPRDLFDGERLSAKGFDETDPDTATMLEKKLSTPMEIHADYGPIIDGVTGAGALMASTNPANHKEVIGRVVFAAPAQVEMACEKAAAAQNDWAGTPAKERAAILRKAAELMEARTPSFMQIAAREAGKTVIDAIAEIREAVDFLRYYADQAEKLQGAPLGVVACISPWNFPLAIFTGQVSAALAAGNAVIAKPAEQTPIMADAAVKLLHEAGVPKSALHLLPGDGPSVGGPLVKNEHVKGVVFTGSTQVAQIINRSLCEAGKPGAPLIAETGGINAMIIDSTALLEQAVLDVVASAFQSAGQRCSACRLVCIQEDVAGRFMQMLAGAMAELSVGDPAKLSTDVGPVIDADALKGLQAHISEMETKARLIARAPEIVDAADGSFLRPVAFELTSIADLTREVFGPVLHVVKFRASDIVNLVDEINALGFGLTLGVHTRIDETMHEIVARARVGNIYVNRNQIGAVVGVQPFGGEGLSGTGPKAGGPHYLTALQKRPVPAGAGEISLSKSAPLPLFIQQMARATAAFEKYSLAADRRELLVKAAATNADTAEIFRQAVTIFGEHFVEAETLPGPTGESNTLRLKARGLILCLGGGNEMANRRQIAIALASGAGVLCAQGLADRLSAALARAGAPAGLVEGVFNAGTINEAALLDARIRAVVFDGDDASRADIAALLARRDGPIAPLLSSRDHPARYAVERTLTINTTAAGGDVRLLSLTD